MRRYAYLKQPLPRSGERCIYKIMLCIAEEGVYLFAYDRPDAVQCFADYCYGTEEELYDEWNALIDENGWQKLDDPLPGCQQDAFLPLRVKGRDGAAPEWGTYEILVDGRWVPYQPE